MEAADAQTSIALEDHPYVRRFHGEEDPLFTNPPRSGNPTDEASAMSE